jgi:hypothetical protein
MTILGLLDSGGEGEGEACSRGPGLVCELKLDALPVLPGAEDCIRCGGMLQ